MEAGHPTKFQNCWIVIGTTETPTNNILNAFMMFVVIRFAIVLTEMMRMLNMGDPLYR